MKKALSMLLVLVMVLGLFAACAPAGTNNTTGGAANPNPNPSTPNGDNVPVDSETPLQLVWYAASGTSSAFENPHRDQQSFFVQAIFEPLAYDNHEGGFDWALATGYEYNADFTELTIKLRENVKWHDGEAFTAEDVEFSSMTAIVNPNGNSVWDHKGVVGEAEFLASYAPDATPLDSIAGITIVDDHTITYKFDSGMPFAHVSLLTMYILPEHQLSDTSPAEIDKDDMWAGKPVGTGAYVIKDVSFGNYFTCTRNDNYWGEKAGIKNLYFTSYQAGGKESMAIAMAAGNIDYMQGIVVGDQVTYNNVVKNNPDFKVLTQKANSFRAMSFNFDKRQDGNNKIALENVQARRAIRMLMDSATIVQLYEGAAIPINFYAANDELAYTPKDITLDKDYDAATAKALLTEAGWDFNDTLDLAIYYDDIQTQAAMTIMKEHFAAAGVKLNVILLKDNLAAALYEICNYDILYSALSCSDIDPLASYWQMTSRRSYTFIAKEGGTMYNYMADRYDAKFAEYEALTSIAERQAMATEIMAMAYEDCISFPLYAQTKVEGYNAAHVQCPEFTYFNERNMRWHEWKMLH